MLIAWTARVPHSTLHSLCQQHWFLNMQTPYLLIKSDDSSVSTHVSMDHRQQVQHSVSGYQFLFYPPDNEREIARFQDRVHSEGDSLYYEDGFMLKYPEAYAPKVRDKLSLFTMPTPELDGFFSRIQLHDDTVTIDGSGLYLQLLFSYQKNGLIAFSNNLQLLRDFLISNDISLETNEDFFANHQFNYSLAYYCSAGTQYREISFHDSMETITINDTVNSHLDNKFFLDRFAALERKDRIELLHKKLSYSLTEYVRYIGVDKIGHNVTGGRDARTSFSLFLGEFRDELEIELVTGGFNYSHDKVISNFIAKRYDLKVRHSDEIVSDYEFNYRAVMDKEFAEEWFLPLFLKVQVNTNFNSHDFVANGYLGNVMTFSGTHKNQIITDNRYKLEETWVSKLEDNYFDKLAKLEAVYGDKACAMFNIMYNTTNKIASHRRRLKQSTFCIFEFDFFQMCYLLESDHEKKCGSLHYELMRRANPDLLTTVPFESNKSFEGMEDTFEMQGFKDAGMPRPYKKFLEANLPSIIKHLRDNRHNTAYLSDGFYDLLEEFQGKEIPPLLTNKIYAALGALEFKGIKYEGYTSKLNIQGGNLYTVEFFEGLYLESQLYSSGLPAMVYTDQVVFKSYLKLESQEKFRVVIRNAETSEQFPVEILPEVDGYLMKFTVPTSAKYRVNFSKYNPETKLITQLFKTSFVAKLKFHTESDVLPSNGNLSSIPVAL